MIRRKPEYEYQWLSTGKAAKQPSMIIRPLPQDIQAILRKNFGEQNHPQQPGHQKKSIPTTAPSSNQTALIK